MEEAIKCPICDKRIFDLEWQGKTVVKIKCIHCRKVVTITKEATRPPAKQQAI